MIHKNVKIINCVILIIFMILLITNYNKYGKSLQYSLLGIFPFSISIAGLIACFIRRWIVIIIPYIILMIYYNLSEDLPLVIVGLYLMFLIGYVYLNHKLCYKK